MNSYSQSQFTRSRNRLACARSSCLLAWCATILLAGALSASAATWTVTNVWDNGVGSLRGAIAAAANGDTITFSIPASSRIVLYSGPLVISNKVLTIAGPGPTNLTISGNVSTTVFNIISNSAVNLSSLTIIQGNGAIHASGYYYLTNGQYSLATSVTLSNVVVSGNSSQDYGAIDAELCNFQIIDSVVSGNTSQYGGAIFLSSGMTVVSNTIVTGNSSGGAITAYGGTLQIHASTISSNLGSGIFDDSGILQIDNSSICGNGSSNSFGGGISLIAYYLTGQLQPFVLALTNVIVSGNVASNGGAIYFDQEADGMFETGCSKVVISNNVAWAGGGICVRAHATVTMANLSLIGNAATQIGGAIYNEAGSLTLSNSSVMGNAARLGGAIASAGGGEGTGASLVLLNDQFIANSAFSGGAIFQNPDTYGVSALIFNSTFAHNQATNTGGAICSVALGGSGYVAVTGSTFDGNTAASGGAIFSSGAPYLGYQCYPSVGITNSTLSGNSAILGGGVYNTYYFQPNPFDPEPTNGLVIVKIINSTFSSNAGANGGGSIFNLNAGPGNTLVQIGSSILNASGFGNSISNSAGTITSLGYNLSSDNAGGALTNGTDLINTDPMLGPLRDNGGAVFSHALLPGSPAIDQGYNFSGFANDGRGLGFVRTYDYPVIANALNGDGTDIGAFELQPATTDFATWQLQYFGCTNCPQSAPSADPDGDGANNMAEFLAGTNPRNSASVFRVLSVTPQGNDLLVTWQTAGGHTNVLQSSGSLANGSFSDISPAIVIPGTGDATNSYLETGAALNGSNSFYRVRLGQ